MQQKMNIMTGLRVFLICLLSLAYSDTFAQNEELTQARQFVTDKNYDKALPLFKKLFSKIPTDESVYKDYFSTLLVVKKYKDAENLVNEQIKTHPQNPLLYIDLGNVNMVSGKDKKAEDAFNDALNYLNGDDIRTQLVASAFVALGKDQYAIKAFEKVKMMMGNNPYTAFLYGGPLSKLYVKTGAIDKAIDILIEGMPYTPTGIESVKANLLELLGTDQAKLQASSKALIKDINIHPENLNYVELLTWLYTQRGDWDGALIQMQAVDERNKETGNHLLAFANTAFKEKQYDIAIKALDIVIEKGKDQPNYKTAKSEKLIVQFQQIKSNPDYTPLQVSDLVHVFDTFFIEFPHSYAEPLVQEYASLYAQYNNDPRQGINILKQAVGMQNTSREFAAQCKLQMGDYYTLIDKVWDASLMYGQVDKDFRLDALGEDARFRRSRLAYYRGDFEWAQGQLSVLKASTSELIANDALYLSVLITENVGKDSNVVPLQRFAHADLLLFQNKDKEAETLLDSITTAFPKHPLEDDILMLHARFSRKHRNYTKALDYLKDIYTRFGKDVLADDAVFKTAEIYELYLHQPDNAKKFYEQLIIDYPGSTFVQTARQRLRLLSTAHS